MYHVCITRLLLSITESQQHQVTGSHTEPPAVPAVSSTQPAAGQDGGKPKRYSTQRQSTRE